MGIVINTHIAFIVNSQHYQITCYATDMVSVNLLFFILRYFVEMNDVHIFFR
jgi:hypothetical protein